MDNVELSPITRKSTRPKTRLEDAMEAYMEDHDPEDVPLVGAGGMEISHYKDHPEDGGGNSSSSSCFGDTWRLTGGLILAVVMASPFLFYRPDYSNTYAADGLQCAVDLNIQYSQLYQDVSQATSWCKEKENENCDCTNPLVPQKYVLLDNKNHQKGWDKVFEENKRIASSKSSPDVVIVGDSITEFWRGTYMGNEQANLANNSVIFKKLFDKSSGAEIEGMPLGISGDRCPQLLYRLQNGEAPSTLTPKVWWMLIGTNDLGSGHCDPPSVLMGIIQIAQELRRRNDGGWIIANSILPRSEKGSFDLKDNNIWKDISWINQRLECFCEGEDRIDFFNATSLFVTPYNKISKSLLPDGLHPVGVGAQVFGQAIANKVQELMKEHG